MPDIVDPFAASGGSGGIVDPFAQPQPTLPPTASRGPIGELGTAFERSALVGLPSSVGKGLRFVGHYLGSDALSQAGQGMVSSAQARGEQPGLSLQPEGHSGMLNTATNVIAGVGDYLPALAAGIAALFTGGATAPLVAPLMAAGNVAGGLEAGEESREKVEKAGGASGAAGLASAAATTAWNFLGGKVMSGVMNGVSNPMTKAIGNVVRGDGTAMFNDTWSQLTGTGGVVGPLLKQLAPTMAEMVGIGAGQAATQAGIERLAGDQNAHPLDAALDALGPSAVAGALMTAAGAPMRVVGNRAARGRTDLLTDAATPPEQRQQIAEQYTQALATVDPQKAAAFRANAQTAIDKGLPLSIDSSVFTAGSVQPPEAAAPSVVKSGAGLAPQALIDQAVGVTTPPPPLDMEGKPLTKAAFADTPLAQDAQGQPLTGQALAKAFKQYQTDVKAHVDRQAAIEAALNEPSGVRVQDANGIERELSMAELMNQRAGGEPTPPAAPAPAEVPRVEAQPQAGPPAEPEQASAAQAPAAPAEAPVAPPPRAPNDPKSIDEISRDAQTLAQASGKGPLKAQDIKKLNEKLQAAGVFDAKTHQEQIEALDDALQTTNSNTNYGARMKMLLDKWQTEMPKAPEEAAPSEAAKPAAPEAAHPSLPEEASSFSVEPKAESEKPINGAAPPQAEALGKNIETPSPANSEPSPGTAQAMEEMGENNPPDTPHERAGRLIERLQSVLADFHTRNRNGEKIAAMPALEQERYGHAVDLKNGLAQIQQGRARAPNENWWHTAEDTVGKLEKPLEAPLEKQGVPEPANPLREHVAKGAPLSDTLAHLAKNGSTPGARTLAQRLQGLNLNTTLHSNFLEARIAGRYNPQLDRIEINQGHESEPTVLHEATHAGLYSTIEQAKRIDQPANQREAQLKQAYRDWEQIRQNALRHTTAADQYGLTNAQEFGAELMSRPEFQDFLKGLKADGSKASLWSKAVDTARRFLGLEVDDRNALERAMDAANVMFDAAKNSREFDTSPQGAARALDATLEPLAKKADEWGEKVPLAATSRPVFEHMLSWKTVDFIAHQVRNTPEMVASGFAKAVDMLRGARDAKRIVNRSIAHPLGKYVTNVERALRATRDYKVWRDRMTTIGSEASIGGFDYRLNYADNVKAGRQLDSSAKAWVDDIHRQFTQMKQMQPKLAELLQEGELHNRKLLVQTNAVLAHNLLGATVGVVPRLEAELSRLPANDANRARLEQQIALRRTEAGFVARHLGGLDIMGRDLDEVRNGDAAKHLDGASYALANRLDKLFKDAAVTLPKGNGLRGHLAELGQGYGAQLRNPYFSLGRDGNFYVKIAFNGKLDPQTQQRLNAALQGTNKILGNTDGQDHAFFRVKTLDQAQGLFNKLVAAGGKGIDVSKSERGPLADKSGLSSHGVTGALRQLQAAISDGMDLDHTLNPAQAEQMRATLNRALLSMLPETSARSAKMQRRGVPGYDADFVGSFARRSVGAAQELANLYTHRQYAAAIKGMADSARSMRVGNQSLEMADRAQKVADELNARYTNSMTPLDNSAINLITSLGNSFYLALSPAFLIRTMAQPWHRGLPHMGSRFGFGATAKAMAANTGAMMKIIQHSIAAGYREDGVRGAMNTGMRFSDLGLSAEKTAFLQDMHDRGVLELGNAQQLQQMMQGRSQWQQDVTRTASAVAQYAEMTNRGITGLAAFDLARKSGMSVEAATHYAHEAINTVMDNFDADNTARATSKYGKAGKWTPLMAMFMNYRLQTMQTIARTVHDGLFSRALPGETAEQLATRKAQAGREFAGLLATTAMISGVMGLPFANAIAGLYNQAKAWLDPDNPGDIRQDVRNHINRTFGDGLGDVIANGVGHLVHMDTSTFGLQDLLPGTEFLASRAKWQDRVQEEAQQLLGPAINAGLDIMAGANKVYDGNYVKGIEAMLPSGLKPAYKAAELAGVIGPGGYTDSRGLPLGAPFDKAGSWDVMLQAAGFRTSEKALHDEAQADLSATREQLSARREVLGQRLIRAQADPQATQAALGDVMHFNAANPYQPMMDLADIYKRYYLERALGSAAGLGVSLTRREYPLAQQQLGYAAMPRSQ